MATRTRTRPAPVAGTRSRPTSSGRTAARSGSPARTPAGRGTARPSARATTGGEGWWSRARRQLSEGGRGRSRPTKAARISGDARLRAFTVVLVLVPLLLLGRVAYLQVVEPNRLVEFASKRRDRTVTLWATRGSILDRHGDAIVMTVPAVTVAADPTLIEDAPKLAAELAPVLGLEVPALVTKLETPDTRAVTLAKQVETAVGDRVRELGLPGIVVVSDPKRAGVGGETARSLIGSLNQAGLGDPNGAVARSGLEKQYDEVLRPRHGTMTLERGAGGATIPGSERLVTAARDGGDLQLTLDRPLQFAVERILLEEVAASQAQGGTVVVGKPATGEILAMASAGTTDGVLGTGGVNLAVRTYEPGSVMKPMVVSAAFDAGLVQPDTRLVVDDEIRLGDWTIRDAHAHPTTAMSVTEILAQSSNVGTIMVAQQLGQERILSALSRFGFGRVTALDLGVEQEGILKQEWNGSDIGSIPIGQSVTVTPLQLWSAYNALANGGIYVPPRLVVDIVDAEGRHLAPPPPASHRVISAAAAAKTTRALQEVVEEGTGKKWAIPGYTVAAKTGTAYKPIGDGTYGGGRKGRKYAASFVGYFPAAAPQISIAVMIDEPKVRTSGSASGGPVFARVAREAIRRYGIVADQDAQATAGPVRAAVTRRPPPPTTTTTTAPPAVDASGRPVDATLAAAGAAPAPAAVPSPEVAATGGPPP